MIFKKFLTNITNIALNPVLTENVFSWWILPVDWSDMPMNYAIIYFLILSFGKSDQFVGFSEKYSSFFCHTFAAVKSV